MKTFHRIMRAIAIVFLLMVALAAATIFGPGHSEPLRLFNLAVFAVFLASIHGCVVLLTREIV